MSRKDESNERGCLFYIGITILIMFIFVVIIAAAIGLKVKSTIDEFTETKPIEFFDKPIDTQFESALNSKIETFSSAVKDGIDEIEISFDEEEINTLIRTHQSLAMLKDKVRINLRDQKLRGDVSLSLKALETGFLDNRYVNGMAEFKISHENEKLNISLQALKIKDFDIPAQFMANLSQLNFVESMHQNPNTNQAMKYLLGIDIKDDLLIIRAGTTESDE